MKKTFIHNLSWLLFGSIIAKTIGGVYRIILTRILGANIGLYQMVFSVYSVLVLLVSSGIPISISKIISGQASTKLREKTIRGIMTLLLVVSGAMAIVLILSSRGIALLQGESSVWFCYVLLAPSLVFSAMVAVLKGYCQGSGRFNISAISVILEQIVRVVSGIVFMLLLARYYVLGALIGAMLGSLLGDAVSFIFLRLAMRHKLQIKLSRTSISDGYKVLKVGYPLLLYSLLVPFSNFVDSFLVVKLLNINFSQSTSTLLYGIQAGVVGSLVSFPGIFSFSLVNVLMPSLSSDYVNKDINRFNQKVCLAFKLMLFIVMPCVLFFSVNASNIINLIYGDAINAYGVNGRYIAKNLLAISSIGIVFSSISQLSAVVLQNINKSHIPIINLSVGLLSKLLIEIMFIPSNRIGIYAYGIAIATGFVIAGILNLYAIEKHVGNVFNINYVIRLSSVLILVLGLFVIFKLFNSVWVFVLGSLFTAIVYLIAIWLGKVFDKKDINLLINNK